MKKPKGVDKVQDSAKSVFREWWEYSTINSSDRFSQKLYKLLVRILGIVLIIIFSPVIAIVLFVAFIAVV